MKVIVGLGNTGALFQKNRHNLGFWFIDQFHSFMGCSSFITELNSELSKNNSFQGHKYILCKPIGCINNSGQVICKLLNDLEVDPKNMIILYDELDILIGRYKLTKKKSKFISHRGVRDIDMWYPEESILKLKIGIGPKSRDNLKIKSYVLEDFNEIEYQELESIKLEIFRILKKFILLNDLELSNPVNFLYI